MAVSINSVYQKVLAIVNKEQRGYITPQEFNLFADQAQREVFNSYVKQHAQLLVLPKNDSRHGDMLDVLEEKLNPFQVFDQTAPLFLSATPPNSPKSSFLPNNLYKLISVKVGGKEAAELTMKESARVLNGHKIIRPHNDRPYFVRRQNPNPVTTGPTSPGIINIYGDNNTVINNVNVFVTIDFIRTPVKPNWGYILAPYVGSNGVNEPLYNPGTTVDFELHSSEASNLVLKIVQLAGIMIEDPTIYQAGVAEEQANK
tara:strand:+ start:968 stop:1741 length:774 start_codon:yes stop_codon:yes gene_type:complete